MKRKLLTALICLIAAPGLADQVNLNTDAGPTQERSINEELSKQNAMNTELYGHNIASGACIGNVIVLTKDDESTVTTTIPCDSQIGISVVSDALALSYAGTATSIPISTVFADYYQKTQVDSLIAALEDEDIANGVVSGSTLTLTRNDGSTIIITGLPSGDGGTDDQTASEVTVTDSAGYYTGTTVEAILAEIYPQLGGASITVDTAIIDGSSNPATGDAIHTALAEKANTADLGTAAALDAGTAPGNVVQLGAACTVGDGAYTDQATCEANSGEWVGVISIICDADTEDCDTRLDLLSAYEIDRRIAAGGGGSTQNITVSTSAPSGGSDGDVWYVVQ